MVYSPIAFVGNVRKTTLSSLSIALLRSAVNVGRRDGTGRVTGENSLTSPTVFAPVSRCRRRTGSKIRAPTVFVAFCPGLRNRNCGYHNRGICQVYIFQQNVLTRHGLISESCRSNGRKTQISQLKLSTCVNIGVYSILIKDQIQLYFYMYKYSTPMFRFSSLL